VSEWSLVSSEQAHHSPNTLFVVLTSSNVSTHTANIALIYNDN